MRNTSSTFGKIKAWTKQSAIFIFITTIDIASNDLRSERVWQNDVYCFNGFLSTTLGVKEKGVLNQRFFY